MDSTSAQPNLTKIKWAHAVNSCSELQEALKNNKIQMLEADIILGQINNCGSFLPVMGHPPATSSDITLKDFLLTVLEFNQNAINSKGVKLDFKSIEVFEKSLGILEELWNKITFEIWLNADIVKGPVEQTKTIPVNPVRFLEGSRKFDRAILSIGWTTLWGPEFREGVYTKDELTDMIAAIKDNHITNKNITFPIRAGIAANSLKEMKQFIQDLGTDNFYTFTIWSSLQDFVDVANLKTFILEFGFDRVYLDVPKDLEDKLNL